MGKEEDNKLMREAQTAKIVFVSRAQQLHKDGQNKDKLGPKPPGG